VDFLRVILLICVMAGLVLVFIGIFVWVGRPDLRQHSTTSLKHPGVTFTAIRNFGPIALGVALVLISIYLWIYGFTAIL
jgi:hypothetical protein